MTERTTRFGIGAPIVAVEREPKNRRADFAPSRIFYSVTVVAHFEGRRCILSFEDPPATETVTFNGRTVPLAADFTVPRPSNISDRSLAIGSGDVYHWAAQPEPLLA